MGSIGLGYFIIIILAWIYRIQGKRAFQELALLTGNRMFALISILIFLEWIYHYYWLVPIEVWADRWTFVKRSGGYIIYALPIFFLLFGLMFLSNSIARNIWIATLLSIIGLYQNVSYFYPDYSSENIFLYYLSYYNDYLHSSWSYVPPSIILFLSKNGIFLLIWFFFFNHKKKKIQSIKNMNLENHLIQN